MLGLSIKIRRINYIMFPQLSRAAILEDKGLYPDVFISMIPRHGIIVGLKDIYALFQ